MSSTSSNPVVRQDAYLFASPMKRMLVEFPVEATGLDGFLNVNYTNSAASIVHLFPPGFILGMPYVMADLSPLILHLQSQWDLKVRLARARDVVISQVDFVEAAKILIDGCHPRSSVKMKIVDQQRVVKAGFISSSEMPRIFTGTQPDYFRFDSSLGQFLRSPFKFSGFEHENGPVLLRIDDLQEIETLFSSLISCQEIGL